MASNTQSSSSKSLLNSCPYVFVSNDLMQLIDPDKEQGNKTPSSLNAHLTTMDDLLLLLKNYIVKNNLYDPTNASKILVHETELGSLLGKSEFSLCDVRDILIEKFIYPVQTKYPSEVICSISEKTCEPRKRKLDCLIDTEFSAKKTNYDSSPESRLSIQGYETEYVKDSTCDDNSSVGNFSNLIFADAYDVHVEYEIESDSDFSYESGSDIENIVTSAVLNFIARSTDSDLEYLADGSGAESHSEEEISEKDKWCCSSCFHWNRPQMGLCEVCLVAREGWLSDKKGQKRTCAKERNRRGNSERSKRRLSKRCKNKKMERQNSSNKLSDLPSVAKERLSTSSDVFPSNSFEAGTKQLSNKSGLSENLCLFCCDKPADSSLIHGKFGCRICCFKCGSRLKKSNQRCPACRRTIERVIYLFNA